MTVTVVPVAVAVVVLAVVVVVPAVTVVAQAIKVVILITVANEVNIHQNIRLFVLFFLYKYIG